MNMGFTCSGCENTWTGANVAHCAAAECHQTFSTVTWFDKHRVRGKCVDPAKLKVKTGVHAGEPLLKMGASGKWIGAASVPEFWKTEDA
jgi:hypothetical protein